jgi:hypothetical protein
LSYEAGIALAPRGAVLLTLAARPAAADARERELPAGMRPLVRKVKPNGPMLGVL